MNGRGVILYGPPAAGKDTVTRVLVSFDRRFVPFARLKAGPGREDGYRTTSGAVLDRLQLADEVLWENQRYGARYVIDRPYLLSQLTPERVPVVHLGQPDGVAAVVRDPVLSARWAVVALWCPRPVAEQRLISRGSRDLSARLAAWDETPRLDTADLTIDTSKADPLTAARLIQAHTSAHLLLG
jgi:guanylate kinase